MKAWKRYPAVRRRWRRTRRASRSTLHYASDGPFIGREKLKVIYHNRMTDATGAIRPEIEQGGCQPAGR